MFVVGITAPLTAETPATSEQVDDLIDQVLDELDRLGMEPDIGTTGLGDRFEMRIEVLVRARTADDALAEGVAAIKCGLIAARVNIAEMGDPPPAAEVLLDTPPMHLFHMAEPPAIAEPIPA